MSTANGLGIVKDDFDQYNAMKIAILNGGINHIETGHSHRKQRSERVIGALLRTLIEKYGFKREEFFISSKQGFISHDSVDNIPKDLIVEELQQQHNIPS